MTTRRTARARAFAPDPAAPGRCCDMPGCDAAGEYRAPKTRDFRPDYYWFCLNHVRDYNARWDFYRGMTPIEIEAATRADIGWQRPTWPLGHIGHAGAQSFRDPFGLFTQPETKPTPQIPPELRQPLDVLGLAWPTSMDEVKKRWKMLAKRHHPDANGGDKGAEERLKAVNLAYSALRTHLAHHDPVDPAREEARAREAAG